MLSRSGWLWLNFVIIPASCNHFLENIIHREKKHEQESDYDKVVICL